MRSKVVKRLGAAMVLAVAGIGLLRQAMAIAFSAKVKSQITETRELSRIQARGNGIYWNDQAQTVLYEGTVGQALECYERAVAADPDEAVIWQNFATCVFVYRKDAMAHYRLDEQEVYDKAFDLYRQALRADPGNFALATDMAMTYYGVHPQRPEDAIAAWNSVLRLANNDVERESIYLHLARTLLNARRMDDARRFLSKVAHPENAAMKETLTRRLQPAG